MAEKVKAIKLVDGTVTNLVDKKTKLSVNYKPVTTYYDGSAMTNAKVDGDLYIKNGTTFYRKVIDKDGELFLEKDTMAQMRALTAFETLLLKAGVYKGVKLNGYYTKGDTPLPIEYILSTTINTDDGGSVIVINDIKLEHDFKGEVDVRYYGVINNGSNQTEVVEKILNYNAGKEIIFRDISVGVKNISLLDHTNIKGYNAEIKVYEGDGFIAESLNTVRVSGIRFTSVDQALGFRHLNIKDCFGVDVSKNTFDGGENGLRLVNCSNSRVYKNHGKQMRIWAIYVEGGTDLLVDSNICYGSITADGLKFGGSTSAEVPITKLTRATISNNICYGNFLDGIDCAGNQFDTVFLTGNQLSNNGQQGIEFKILSFHQGYAKNAVISNNICVNNGGVGISAGVENALSTTDLSICYNTLRGSGVLGTPQTYAITAQTRGNTNSRVLIYNNNIRDYYFGIRINNSSYIEIFRNNINCKRFGIYLRNGTSGDVISNINIYKNEIKTYDHSCISVGVVTDTSIIGTINSVVSRDNEVEMSSYLQKPIFYQTGAVVTHFNNQIGVYGGSLEAPSFPSNKGELVVATNPIDRGFRRWIAYVDNEINQRLYSPCDWITIPNATASVKGLVNQSAYSADTTTQASGANPTKAEFDALLAELRDLKSKMRTSGQAASS